MTDVVERIITPMPLEEVAKIKAAVEARWEEKPHYPGGGGILSPGCMFRAEEILSMIAALEDARKTAIEEAAKVADEAAEGTDGLTDGEIWIAGRIATTIRALVKP